jgi:hypothetical protein
MVSRVTALTDRVELAVVAGGASLSDSHSGLGPTANMPPSTISCRRHVPTCRQALADGNAVAVPISGPDPMLKNVGILSAVSGPPYSPQFRFSLGKLASVLGPRRFKAMSAYCFCRLASKVTTTFSEPSAASKPVESSTFPIFA